jgi:RHS repeat-associated protein
MRFVLGLLVLVGLGVTASAASAVSTGAISGKVTATAGGAPIEGIEVCAEDQASPSGEHCVLSTASGEYTVGGLADGEYEVFFAPAEGSDLNYVSRFYPHSVVVAGGAVTTGIDQALTVGAVVKGTVSGGNPSSPLAEIRACAFATSEPGEGPPGAGGIGWSENCASTDSAGEYELAGLASGEYVVEFQTPSGSPLNYLSQYYDGKSSYAEAEILHLTAGTTTGDIDATLGTGGEITGRVISTVNGAGIAGIEVCGYPLTEGRDNCALTDATGAYTVAGLSTGSYHVEFSVPSESSLNYVRQYFGEGVGGGSSEAVTVTAGAVTPSVDASMQPGATLGGTVVAASTKEPLAGVEVCAQGPRGYYCKTTDATGGYTIASLPAGNYTVHFAAVAGFAAQFWKEGATFAEEQSVEVAATASVTGIDAELQPAAKITGTVTAAAGDAPLEGVKVCRYTVGEEFADTCVYTDASGDYTLGGLAPTAYKLEFSDPEANVLTQYYDGKESLAGADPVNVTPGQAKSGVDAVMQPGGRITGKVTGAADGLPLAGVRVSTVASTGPGYSTTTDANGEYALTGMPTGKYKLVFSATNANLITQYYDGKSSLSGANEVKVTAGATTAGINAAMQVGGELRGRVTDATDGTALAFASVTILGPGGESIDFVETDSNGEYVVKGLPEGSYRVHFLASGFEGQYYDAKATLAAAEPVTVTVGRSSGSIDAALEPLGSIAGTVTDGTSHAGLGGVEVCASPPGDNGYETCTSTGSDGTYKLSLYEAGRYKVAFYPAGDYLRQYYDGKESWEEAAELTVTGGAALTGIDAALQHAGHIKGKVTAAAGGAPLGDIYVCAESATGEYFPCASTDPAGEYDIGELPTGRYTVEFKADEEGDDSNYLTQYYDGRSLSSEADQVAVTAGSTTSGINAALQAGGRIEGKVTDLAGAPLEGADACAYLPDGDAYRCTETDAGGEYSIDGLADGEYVVYFSENGGGYPTQYYDGVPYSGEATPVKVTAGGAARTGIDGKLRANGRIIGTVTSEATGKALAGIEACALTTAGGLESCATTAADGSYSLAVGSGETEVEFRSPNQLYESQYYDGVPSAGEAEAIEVEEGETRTGIDAAMVSPGQITGRVTEEGSGDGVGGIDVCAVSTGSTFVERCADTGPSGEYAIASVPGGEYRVEFLPPPGLNYVLQYYPGKPSSQEAEPVRASAGSVTRNIDAVMQVGGEITGKVTAKGSEAPISGIEVCPSPVTSDGTFTPCARTDAAGQYTLEQLGTGEYRVTFSAPFAGALNWVRQTYDGHANASEGTPLPVTAGEIDDGIDAALEPGGEISGKVIRAGTKAPIANVEVCAYSAETFEFEACAYTDAQGEYTVTGLPAGLEKVEFYNYEYVTRWYKEAEQSYEADAVPVETLHDTSGIDVALKSTNPIVPEVISPPSISGTAEQGETLSERHGTWTNEPIEYRYRWFRCDARGDDCRLIDGAEGQTYVPAGVDVGATIEVEESATNVEGESSPAVSSPTAVVTPAPPVEIWPPVVEGLARAGETLTETHAGWNNEPTSFTYQWERCDREGGNCTLIDGATEQSYELRGADVGHTVKVIETAENAGGESEPAVSGESEVVVPEPPVDLAPPKVTGPAAQGATLNAQHGDWEGEPTGYDYQWERCSAAGDECEPIDDAIFSDYQVTGADVGHELVVAERAENAGGPGQPARSNPTAVVVAAPPANLSQPAILGQAREGGTLYVDPGRWTNEPDALTYQWERCTSAGGSCTPIDGADEETYVPVVADVGHRLVVEETAANAAGSGPAATSAPSPIVVVGVPVNFRAPTIGGEARQGETLTETRGGWTNEPERYEIEWQRCDGSGQGCVTAEAGGEDDEYQLRAADLGHTIKVLETAVNAGGQGDPATSAPTAKVIAAVPVGISPPTIEGQTVQGETLSAIEGGWTNEPSTYGHQWERCTAAGAGCEPIDGATAETYVLTAADVGHRLVVTETATNAAGAGEAQTSAPTAVIEPTVPVNTAPPTISGTARVGSTLTAAHGSWTHQPTGYVLRWERCDEGSCEPIDGATEATYTPTAADLGRPLRVVETASNATGAGEPADSAATAPVAHEPPAVVEPPRIVGSPETGETLLAQHGTWSNEPTEYREQWLRCDADGGNCTAIHDAIEPSYSPTVADAGHGLKVRETARNDGGAGPSADSTATAPVTAQPLRAVPGEDLRATVGASVTFDGSGSTPAGEITDAGWGFGDGNESPGEIVRHTYAAPGEYHATLTVKRGTETDERSITVTVDEPGPEVRITVEDESGEPVSHAEVLYVGSGGVRVDARTDSSGVAVLAGLPDGTDSVDVVADGFRPTVGQVEVAGGNGHATVALARGALATLELTAHEMDLAEIEAAGIDTSDPANQKVSKFEIGPEFSCQINSAGEFVGLDKCRSGGGAGGGGGGGGGSSCTAHVCGGAGGSTWVGGAAGGHPFIERLSLEGTVTTLKQFFEVSLAVYNPSPEPFSFTGGHATLDVPAGMSLAPTSVPQSATEGVADVPGEGSAQARWIIRGDEPGEYVLRASYGAQLEPFAEPFELEAVAGHALKVWGAEALGLTIKADSGALKEGDPYHVRIGVYDKADIPFYNVAVGINRERHDNFVFQPGQEFERSVGELKPGDTIFAPEDILVPDADGGNFDPAESFARFVGESAAPGEGFEAISPAPLYTLSASLSSATMIHLHWQSSPGAEGYEVFSTPDLDTAFEESPDAVRTTPSGGTVTRLGAGATDAYIPRAVADPPRFYAVATLIGGRPRLEHPVREPSIQGPIGGPLTLRELLAGGHNPSESCLQCTMDRITHADPVDAPTGNFWHSFTDLSVPGRGLALDLQRTYNSGAAPIDGPFGHGWSFTYGMSLSFPEAGEVVVEQENGSTVEFREEADGSFTAPPRVTAMLRHEGDGSWTFVRHRRETFTFDAAGRLTGETELNGEATTLTYDDGRLESVTDPAGRKLTFAWHEGHIVSVADPLGRTVHYGYDAAGDLVEVIDVERGETRFGYNSEHLLTTMRDPDQAPGVSGSTGAVVTNAYDGQGRETEQTDQLGRTTKFAYAGEPLGGAGGTTTITDPAGNVTVQHYRYGELVSEIQGSGTEEAATWTFAYDQATMGLTAVTDPNGDTTRSTYDAEGNLLTTEDALGRRTVNTYDNLNDLLTSEDPTGATTTDTYDAQGNLLTTSRPLVGTGEVQTTTYTHGDPQHPGDVTALTDPDGRVWHYGHDADGDVTSTTDPLGNETTSTYDAIGRRLTTTSPRGNVAGADTAEFTTAFDYDDFGRLTETVDPLGHTTTRSYDPDQNLLAATDADGNITHYEYDAADELTAVRRADGTTRRTTYTPDGEVKEQIDAAGDATRYAYDALGRVVAITDPLGRTTRRAYDPAGEETSTTDPEGAVTTKSYDAADELIALHYSDGKTPDVSDITYDADGRRTGMTSGTGTWSWKWDSLGRLTSITEGGNGAVGYAYDLAGNLTGIAYPGGKTIGRAYDAAGNLSSITDWLGNTTTFGYDADSDLEQEAFPGGVTTRIADDADGRVSSIGDEAGGTAIAAFGYERDANGQVTGETVENEGATTKDYSYDSLNQLTRADGETYSYDAADNPVGFGAATSQSFDAADQMTSRSEPGEPGEPGEPVEEPGSGPGGGTPEMEPPSSTPEQPVVPPTSNGGPPVGTPSPGAAPPAAGDSKPAYSPPVKGTLTHATSRGGRRTAARLRTKGHGELVVAFVSAAGPAAGGQRVKKLSGDSLHWSLVVRQAVPGGDAEIWQAHASRSATGKVTAELADSGYATAMAIGTYRGSASIKAHASRHGKRSAPTITVPGVDGALVVGVGGSSGQKGGVTPAAGQHVLTEYAAAGGDAGWVQEAGTGGKLADTHTAAQWGMAAVAIVAPSGASADAGPARGAIGSPADGHASPPSDPTAGVAPDPTTAPTAKTAALTAANGAVTIHYAYDQRGNRTQDGTAGAGLSLGYDQANRLVSVGAHISYAYDGDGLRASKTVEGTTTDFLWSEVGELPELLESGDTSYVYGPDGLPIEQITGGTPTFLHGDAQGSTRLLTDADGAVVGRYEYGPWGNVTAHTGSASTNLQFDGQYTDAETGFQYLRARYYDPATGQFLSVDPALALTASPYGFAGNDPLNFADPLGLFSFWHALKITGLVVGTAGALVAGCVFTLCSADVAVAGVSLGAISTGLAVTSIGIDTAITAHDCYGGGDRGDCAGDTFGTALDVGTFGAGKGAKLLFGSAAEHGVDAFGGVAGSIYGWDSYLSGGGGDPQVSSYWAGCEAVGGASPYSTSMLQPTVGANSLQ